MSQASLLDEWQEGLVLDAQTKRQGYQAHDQEAPEWGVRLRVRAIWALIILAYTVVVARVLYLQLFEADQQFLLSESNHLEQIRSVAQRGQILDRNGVVLAESVWDEGTQKWIRKYPLGRAGSSSLGYLSEVGPDELGCEQGLCNSLGTVVGRAGLERAGEAMLRGRDGGRIVEVDAMGQQVRERGRNESEAGTELKTTLDANLIRAMQTAFEQAKVKDAPVTGAAVALNLSGEVLGILSYPSYDPSEVPKYLQDKSENYFLNRAISGLYPPGSTFKLVTTLAGLTQGVIDKESEIEDTGEIRVGEYRYGTWNFDQAGRTEGKLKVVTALARSNDIFFYRVGERVGAEALVKMAKALGLGSLTGIEIAGEASGIVPDPLWKERRTGESWFLGNTYHLAIGQGDLLTTPLQIARMSAAAISGRVCDARMKSETKSSCRELGIESVHLATLREGMREACTTGGTAYPFFDFEPYVICKTGTAQHGGQTEEDDLPHAWITVAYPGENPEMILTVLVESGGEGSAVAGPIAKRILEEWRVLGN